MKLSNQFRPAILTILTVLIWDYSLAVAVSDVKITKALSVDAPVESNGARIHYLGE